MAHNTGRHVYTTPDIRGPFKIGSSAEDSHDTPTAERQLLASSAAPSAAVRPEAAVHDTIDSQRDCVPQ